VFAMFILLVLYLTLPLTSLSFPTRRSSDLRVVSSFPRDTSSAAALLLLSDLATDEGRDDDARVTLLNLTRQFRSARQAPIARFRSEEHTSELQSRDHLVCRLLLDKKKQLDI